MKTEAKVDGMVDTLVSHLECVPSKANLQAMIRQHFGVLDSRIAATRSALHSMHQRYSQCTEQTKEARQAVDQMRKETRLHLLELKKSYKRR